MFTELDYFLRLSSYYLEYQTTLVFNLPFTKYGLINQIEKDTVFLKGNKKGSTFMSSAGKKKAPLGVLFI